MHESRAGRLLERVWLRGELQVLGGLGVGTRLAAAHVPYCGVQAYGFLTGVHEPMVQEAMRRTLGPGATFVDVGANVGITTLVGARLVGPEGRVVALEPAAGPAAAVAANAAVNGFDRVEVVRAAAGARAEEGELIVTADGLWTRLASVGEHPLERERVAVPVVPLDDVLGSAPVDVVKIDVEGAELDVVAGMQRVLAEQRPVVICEMHGKNAAFCAAMREVGYDVVNLDGPLPVEEDGGNVHALCTPPSLRAATRAG